MKTDVWVSYEIRGTKCSLEKKNAFAFLVIREIAKHYFSKGSDRGKRCFNNIVNGLVAHRQRFNVQSFAKCSLIELFLLILHVSAVLLVTRHPSEKPSD